MSFWRNFRHCTWLQWKLSFSSQLWKFRQHDDIFVSVGSPTPDVICDFKSNTWCVSFIFGLLVMLRYMRWCFDEIRLFKETNVPDWPLHTEQLPNSQILECTCSISHNAPFRTEVCTLLFWMEHCGIWNRCILGFVKLVYWKRSNTVHPKNYAHWSSFVVFCCGLISNIYFVGSGAILIPVKKSWMIWMSTVIH